MANNYSIETSKVGFSLKPGFIMGNPILEQEQCLIDLFGSPKEFLTQLKLSGVSSIELRNINNNFSPSDVFSIAKTVWDADLQLSIHGNISAENSENDRLCHIYPSIAQILEVYQNYQNELVITVHPFMPKDDTPKNENVEKLRADSIEILKKWSNSIEHNDDNVYLALELLRKKSYDRPATFCSDLENMVQVIDSKNLGICWDMGHYYYNISNYPEMGTPSEVFLSKVKHTHIHGLSEKGTHCPLIEPGKLPLHDYISSLKQAGFSGIYNMEFSLDKFSMGKTLEKEIFDSINLLINTINK